MLTNAFWFLLYVVLLVAVGGSAYYLGHDRGETRGREQAALTQTETKYYAATVAKLVQLGYEWDGSAWYRPQPSSAGTQPTPLPDRANCAEINGTPYRSSAERNYFLTTCLGRTVTPTPLCGEPSNPWCYDLFPGQLIDSPPPEFCQYFNCVDSFWAGTGYVVRCKDDAFSKTGGTSQACANHGGVSQPVYSH